MPVEYELRLRSQSGIILLVLTRKTARPPWSRTTTSTAIRRPDMKSEHEESAFLDVLFSVLFSGIKGHKHSVKHDILLHRVANLQIYAILNARQDNQLRILRVWSHCFLGVHECREGPFGFQVPLIVNHRLEWFQARDQHRHDTFLMVGHMCRYATKKGNLADAECHYDSIQIPLV